MYEKIGVVVFGKIGSNIANLIFVDGFQPLYILEMDFFTDVDKNTQETKKNSSLLMIGQNIEFNAVGNIIKEFQKAQPYRIVTLNNNKLEVIFYLFF